MAKSKIKEVASLKEKKNCQCQYFILTKFLKTVPGTLVLQLGHPVPWAAWVQAYAIPSMKTEYNSVIYCHQAEANLKNSI